MKSKIFDLTQSTTLGCPRHRADKQILGAAALGYESWGPFGPQYVCEGSLFGKTHFASRFERLPRYKRKTLPRAWGVGPIGQKSEKGGSLGPRRATSEISAGATGARRECWRNPGPRGQSHQKNQYNKRPALRRSHTPWARVPRTLLLYHSK